MGLVWTLLIGFVVGLMARFFTPGKATIQGFVLTTLLGMAGAFTATFLGQFVGLLAPGEQTGFIGSVIGAIIVLFAWQYFLGERRQNKTTGDSQN